MRRALAVLLALLAPAALGLLVPAGAPPSEAFAPGSESFVLDSALLQVNAEAHSEGEAISNQSIHVKAHHRREGREGRRERTSNEAEMLLQQDAALEESEATDRKRRHARHTPEYSPQGGGRREGPENAAAAYSFGGLNVGVTGSASADTVGEDVSSPSAHSNSASTSAVRGLARQLAGLRASLEVLEAQAFCAAASEGVRAEMAYIARDVDDLRRRLADVLTAAPACPEGVGAASSLFTVPEQGRQPSGGAGGGDSEVQIEERQLPRPGSELRSTLDSLSRTFDLPWYGLLAHAPPPPVDRPSQGESSLIQLQAIGVSDAEAEQRNSPAKHNPWDEVLNKQGYGILRPSSQMESHNWALVLVFVILAALVILATGVVAHPLPSKAEKVETVGCRPATNRWRSQFTQVALPFWMATTPSSTGAAFSVLFCSLLVTTACLNFWLAYAGVSVLHWFDPETASSVDRAGIFSNDSIKTAAAIGVALAPTCFLPFQRQLATRRRQWLLLACKMFLLFESQCIKILGTYLASVQMANIVALNADAFWHITRTLQMSLLLIGCLDAFAGSYVESILLLEWRRDLSHYVLKKYMGSQAYYRMNSNSGKDNGADNPDQRIQEDTLIFVTELTNFAFSIISAVVTLLSSSVLIWTVVPQVTVMLLIYTVVGSLVSLWFIWNFAGITYNIQKCEADYRYSLIHVRENAEGIALMGGEKTGEGEIHTRFRDLIEARKQKISWEMMFSCFSFAFTAGGTIVPCVLLAELFFQMKLDVGIVAQVGLNLGRVVSTFSFINNSAMTMSTLAAVTNRIAGLLRKIDNLGEKSQVTRVLTADHEVRLSNLMLRTPDQRLLVQNLDLKLGGDEGPARLAIVGPSGAGKSSLLRTLSGLWGGESSGKVGMPDRGGIMFMPQHPYLAIGSLRIQLCYPDASSSLPDTEMCELLSQVGLGGLQDRLDGDGLDSVCDWSRVLTLGEKQRLAVARCLLHKPKMVVLDDATSALTAAEEGALYARLVDFNMSFISVLSLRESALKYHEKVLQLGDSPADWKLTSSKSYLSQLSECTAAPRAAAEHRFQGAPAAPAAAPAASEPRAPRRALTLVVRDTQGRDTNFKVYSNSPLQRLMEFYCAERSMDSSQVMFNATGKTLEKTATPEELGLEEMSIIRAIPLAA